MICLKSRIFSGVVRVSYYDISLSDNTMFRRADRVHSARAGNLVADTIRGMEVRQVIRINERRYNQAKADAANEHRNQARWIGFFLNNSRTINTPPDRMMEAPMKRPTKRE